MSPGIRPSRRTEFLASGNRLCTQALARRRFSRYRSSPQYASPYASRRGSLPTEGCPSPGSTKIIWAPPKVAVQPEITVTMCPRRSSSQSPRRNPILDGHLQARITPEPGGLDGLLRRHPKEEKVVDDLDQGLGLAISARRTQGEGQLVYP